MGDILHGWGWGHDSWVSRQIGQPSKWAVAVWLLIPKPDHTGYLKQYPHGLIPPLPQEKNMWSSSGLGTSVDLPDLLATHLNQSPVWTHRLAQESRVHASGHLDGGLGWGRGEVLEFGDSFGYEFEGILA